MSLSETFCLFSNRLFPKPKVGGRESPQAYAETEYRWASSSWHRRKRFVDLRGKRVLDGGCGLGGRTVYYAEQGCDSIVGIDIDEERIKFARDFAQKRRAENVEFRVASLDALPFESGEFDIIILDDVVEHIRRPLLVNALKECRRVVKPGGAICLEFPPWTSPYAAHLYDCIHMPWCQLLFSSKTLINVTNKINPAPRHGQLSYIEHFTELNRITIEEFKSLLRELNFDVIHFEQRMVKDIKLLQFVPILNPFLTTRVVAVLSR